MVVTEAAMINIYFSLATPSHGFVALSCEYTFVYEDDRVVALSFSEKPVLEDGKLLLILKQQVKLIWTPCISLLIHLFISDAKSLVVNA